MELQYYFMFARFLAIKGAYIIVTGPAKIGHICTQNFALFLNFNLQYLLKYKIYDNEMLMLIHKSIRKQRKFTELEYLKHRSSKLPFSEHL